MNYEEKEFNRKCNIFKRLFRFSLVKGYDSPKFVRQIMTTDEYNDLLKNDFGQEWCDEQFLLNKLEHIKPFKKGKHFIDEYEMGFIGYLYKYWMQKSKKKPKDIYKILPIEIFHANFPFYHTQGENYIINDAVRMHKEKRWDIVID